MVINIIINYLQFYIIVKIYQNCGSLLGLICSNRESWLNPVYIIQLGELWTFWKFLRLLQIERRFSCTEMVILTLNNVPKIKISVRIE